MCAFHRHDNFEFSYGDPWLLPWVKTNSSLQTTDKIQALLHVINLVDWPKHVKTPLWIVSGCKV